MSWTELAAAYVLLYFIGGTVLRLVWRPPLVHDATLLNAAETVLTLIVYPFVGAVSVWMTVFYIAFWLEGRRENDDADYPPPRQRTTPTHSGGTDELGSSVQWLSGNVDEESASDDRDETIDLITDFGEDH